MRNQQEHYDQCIVMNWCELNKTKYPCLGFIYAIPNMSMAHVNFRVKMKAEGLKKGMVDWCLPWPKQDFIAGEMVGHGNFYVVCGLYVEMKVKPNKPTPEQEAWLEWLSSVGFVAKVAWSADQAIGYLKEYVNPDETKWTDFQ